MAYGTATSPGRDAAPGRAACVHREPGVADDHVGMPRSSQYLREVRHAVDEAVPLKFRTCCTGRPRRALRERRQQLVERLVGLLRDGLHPRRPVHVGDRAEPLGPDRRK